MKFLLVLFFTIASVTCSLYAAPMPTDSNLSMITSIAHSDKQWVAVGGENSLNNTALILNSPDGQQWNVQLRDVAKPLQAVAWGNNTFVAVGQGSTILYSYDGVNWRPASISGNFNDNLSDVIWSSAANQFIAVGGSDIYVSNNGLSWQVSSNPDPLSNTLQSLATDGHIIVALGENGTVLTSTDAINWNLEAKLPTAAYDVFSKIAWNGKEFLVAASSGMLGMQPIVLTSTDGKTWKNNLSQNLPSSAIYGMSTFNSKFILGSDSGAISNSTLGQNWAYAKLPPPPNPGLRVSYRYLRDIDCNTQLCIAGGVYVISDPSGGSSSNQGVLLSSKDGQTWTLDTKILLTKNKSKL